VAYRVEILDGAAKDLKRLGPEVARRVAGRVAGRLRWLGEHFEQIEPQPLTHDLAGYFKLRVGDHRAIYEVLHGERILVVHAVDHRREIYRHR
jgi:mRNA interferase RelE/StbE